jgi:hypothetical protein
LKLEKWNKTPRNLIGTKYIFEIFWLKSLKKKRRKRKMVQSIPPSPADPSRLISRDLQ